MMLKKTISLFFLLLFKIIFAQQNIEFVKAKQYFDTQQFLLKTEFSKKIKTENGLFEKEILKTEFLEFMKKMDSLRNSVYINVLIKVKNQEDLGKFLSISQNTKTQISPKPSNEPQIADYPGGVNVLRKQVADLFYTDGVKQDQKIIKTFVTFVVERDGNISSVRAEGENFTFNRQAEIAMYLLPEKFTPAKIDGIPVRFRYRLPVTINFE